MTTDHGLRFSANLGWLFGEVPFEERFDAAAEAGFCAVEYASPYGRSPVELRRRLKDAGLRQVLINSPVGPPGTPTAAGTACMPDRVGEFRDGVIRALGYAVELECPLVHLRAGVRPAGVPRDTAFSRYVANVAWAGQLASSAGVRLVIEAVNARDIPGYFLQTQEQAAGVVAAVGSAQVGMLFDIYHCQMSQGDLSTRLEEHLPTIAHIQVADVPGRAEPGTGEIAWDFVFDRLRARGYPGWIGCEYRPANATADGLEWLTRYAPEGNG
ncbi:MULTISPECIES: hydroxypyruvate isomerase family protein [Streptomyces]|uniref:TIM barrel protein n=1 Tax=Streptomyces rhizosphaericus TaxID=114699 RepID=A0A6G4AH64_9ACTN|nr:MULTISPECIES: TIM barrel protein [Streptomyces]EXU64117.1 hydroxypyruvate isomerase [Streptomyces sp. PRh5]NEW72683.1 TIM barrel protein [Streptomyces rhizosphaericus]TMU98358.1 TIM barrel protein [Streptomyces sp. DASNCL29]